MLSKIKDKSITCNVFKIQDDYYFCVGFIEYMLEGKTYQIILIYFLWIPMKRMIK